MHIAVHFLGFQACSLLQLEALAALRRHLYPLPPLFCVPLLVKDCIVAVGTSTTAGEWASRQGRAGRLAWALSNVDKKTLHWPGLSWQLFGCQGLPPVTAAACGRQRTGWAAQPLCCLPLSSCAGSAAGARHSACDCAASHLCSGPPPPTRRRRCCQSPSSPVTVWATVGLY